MKRVGYLYDQIPDYENLCLAFLKAVKGKRERPEVISFTDNFDANMRRIQDQLIRRDTELGNYRFFKVRDPKPRHICAAPFPERVIHHAVMNICEPHLESYAIHDTWACRKNKGHRAALKRAQTFARRYPWFLKMDIRKYFDSIDHEILLRLLARRFKDPDLMDFFYQILSTYETMPDKGMPIGNLISQHLANFYLGYFDHHIKEQRQAPGYMRYMDDMLVFAPDKARLKEELAYARSFLREQLALEVKDKWQLNRSNRGIPFLGFRVFPHDTRLTPASKKRSVQKFRLYERRHLTGEWTEDELARHMEALFDFMKIGNTIEFRRNLLRRYGASF